MTQSEASNWGQSTDRGKLCCGYAVEHATAHAMPFDDQGLPGGEAEAAGPPYRARARTSRARGQAGRCDASSTDALSPDAHATAQVGAKCAPR